MIGAHLLPSRVRVKRPRSSMQDGILTTSWVSVSDLTAVPCRLEVGLYRPGKDQPLPAQAGRAPDRVAVYWVAPGTDFRPGDHLECVSGPVVGTWEVRTFPDAATGMIHLHHLEGQVVEVPGSMAVSGQ